jgi:cytochrome P450 monooxygenase
MGLRDEHGKQSMAACPRLSRTNNPYGEHRMTASEDLPALGSQQSQLGRLNPLMRSLQLQGPISRVRTYTGDEAWLVTRHGELKQLLLDNRLGLTHPDPANRSRYLDHPLLDLLVVNDDPDVVRERHRQMRAVLTPHFSARRISSLQPRIAASVSDMLDAIVDQGPPVDIHAELTLPLSFHVLCDLLQIPDRETYMALLSGLGTDAGPENTETLQHPLFGYMMELASHKREYPDDGIISRLCKSGIADHHVATMMTIVSTTYQVTPSNISAGIALFAINTDQRDLLLQNPELLPQAIEEVLRMSKVEESFVPRYASEDIEIGGVTIRAGDLVLCDHYSVGFDDHVFDQPERFDITRSPNPHLAFSLGITHCIGEPLARLEIEEVFTGIFSRMPALHLAVPRDQIRVMTNQLGGGIAELPVLW